VINSVYPLSAEWMVMDYLRLSVGVLDSAV